MLQIHLTRKYKGATRENHWEETRLCVNKETPQDRKRYPRVCGENSRVQVNTLGCAELPSRFGD
jgi:hypothetical protein